MHGSLAASPHASHQKSTKNEKAREGGEHKKKKADHRFSRECVLPFCSRSEGSPAKNISYKKSSGYLGLS